MKSPSRAILIIIVGLAWIWPITTQAQLVITVNPPNTIVPDYDVSPAGTYSSTLVSTPYHVVDKVEVSLNLAPTGLEGFTFNGDYFVYLTHTDSEDRSGIAVLLNRVGKSADNTTGYGDNGFNVTFKDDAPQGDIHTYRLSLYGDANHAVPSPGTLTGVWQPDGRETDPTTVSTAHARTAPLSGFRGLDPNGFWTLYLQDFASGGDARLESWTLSITTVPEPAPTAVIFAAGLLGWVALRRRQVEARSSQPAQLV